MAIGQRQSEGNAATRGLHFHPASLSLRARAWFAAFLVLTVAGCAFAQTVAPRSRR